MRLGAFDVGKWCPGQTAVIDRSRIVTIERVTPKGYAIVEGRRFSPLDEKHVSAYCGKEKLEPLTPEIQAGMDQAKRAEIAYKKLYARIEEAEKWRRETFREVWGRRTAIASPADLDRAERLIAAIWEVLHGEST
jgi:hypothetical protein